MQTCQSWQRTRSTTILGLLLKMLADKRHTEHGKQFYFLILLSRSYLVVIKPFNSNHLPFQLKNLKFILRSFGQQIAVQKFDCHLAPESLWAVA